MAIDTNMTLKSEEDQDTTMTAVNPADLLTLTPSGAAIKPDVDNEDNEDHEDVKFTPINNKVKAVKGKKSDVKTTPKTKRAIEDEDGEETTPGDGKSATKKRRGNAAYRNGIPNSFEEASDADKMIIRMRESGHNWKEIKTAYENLVGHPVGGSTISTRYGRLKDNFTSVKNDDTGLLLRIKAEVEKTFETEKWHKIADAIAGAGGERYPPKALIKKFKELQKRGVPAAAVAQNTSEDADIEEDEEE